MSSGIFGTVKPANITPHLDVEILYYYRPTRSRTDASFDGYKALDPSECLKKSVITESHDAVEGLFELRLPLDKFNMKGFYTVYIRPKECQAKIIDVSVLASYPDIKGVVFNISNGPLAGINDLTGYRMEFEDGTTRIIKSCNRCEPVSVNNGDGYPNVTRYILVDTSSDYVFCTVSPSTAPTFKPNALPYIGTPGETVKIMNTKFTPQLIEFEMVDHDADTISYMLEGEQVRDRDNGILTTYNTDNEIYRQFDFYSIKSTLGEPLYDVKKRRNDIDGTQSYENIMNK
jgi:hypothetical protein